MENSLIEKLWESLNPVVVAKGLMIDKLEYAKKGRDYYLTIYVEKEDDVITLDEVCVVSDLISSELDKLDIIQENYILDVSTSGAEKPITDFSKFPKYIGKYIYIKFKFPFSGMNDITGTLEKIEDDTLTISYRVKTRTKYVDVKIDNILKANLAIKF
ncbi:MAG: ribosome maturation factor RimP [Bacillales bacterium]|nr:ribosome maturation factor RimP [Bacillales bacterium]